MFCLMMNKKTLIYRIFLFFLAISCGIGYIFANTSVHTTLAILPPTYEVIYTPPYIPWTYISWFLSVSISGAGIRSNNSGIWNNWTYTFEFYRGTWPFTTWAEYSSGNTWTLMRTTTTIDRIDNILPTFAGGAEWMTYDAPVTITFSDNHPGVTATLNGNPFVNGTTLSTNWTYQLIVTDAVGNSTWATFIIYLDSTPSGWWWGWWAGIGLRELYENFCKARSCYSYRYDGLCGICTIQEEEFYLPGDRPSYHYITPGTPIIDWSSYPQERIDAYQWAYRLWITTIPDIKDANLEWLLYRKIAAKMASEFAIKVIGLTPDKSRICEFDDIADEDLELQYYMKLSCQLGIMGLDYYGSPDTIFNPNYFVTRDQLVTILSRILFRTTFNLYREEYSFFDKVRNLAVHTLTNISSALWLNIQIHTPIDWYTKHLEAIKKLWIITNYTITLKEFKWYTMLIMYRIDQMWLKNVQNIFK